MTAREKVRKYLFKRQNDSWSRFLLEKLIGAQLVKEFSAL
jgi:hypothetical protein